MFKRLARIQSSPWFRFGLGLAISGLTLYLVARDVAFDQVWLAFGQAELGYVCLALASSVGNNLVKAIRWRILLGPKGRQVPYIHILAALLVGQTLNLLLPARAGELSRAYAIGGRGPGRTFTLGTVMLEKVLDMASYAMLFLALLILMPLPGWINNSGYTFAGLTMTVLMAVFLVTNRPVWVLDAAGRVLEYVPARLRSFLQPRLQTAVSSLAVLQSRIDLFKLAILTAFVWGTALLTNQLVLLGLGMRLPFTAPLLVLVALQVGITLPAGPGRIGIFEYICVVSLSLFGIAQAEALSFGILLHAVVLLPVILSGLILYWL